MGSVAAGASYAVELEAKRKEDSSWHPCQVSLSSDVSPSCGLTVDFGSQEPEEVIFTKEEALERLRIRSIPVQGDECFHIKEGEHVLASQEAKFGILFFDAKVEKVCRVRHSKRNPCRCTFKIKWLHKLDTITVPASSLMKLATNTIDIHPTVSSFLNAVETFDHSHVSSIASLLEETGFDSDLEKQIEEITKFAEKDSPENGLLELKRGQVRHRTIASQASVLDNSRRSTRKRKTQVEEKEKPVSAEPDSRLHLSPLGARAALASLMYKLPSEPEFSTTTTTVTLNVTSTVTESDVGIQEKVSVKRTTRLTRSVIEKDIGASNDEDESKKKQRVSKKGEKKSVLSKAQVQPKLRSSPRLRTR